MAKYAVITGASSGIGYATAKAYAAKGLNIIAVARRVERLEGLKQEILAANPAADVVLYPADLSVTEQAKKLYEDLKGYDISVWMNNAGRGNEGDILTEDIERDLAMLRLNCESVFLLSTLFARDHADDEGAALINVSSVGGYAIFPGSTFYCATKYFVAAFTEGLAQELKLNGHKLHVCVLAPGATETEFEQAAHQSDEKVDYSEKFANYSTADEMAQYVISLAESDGTVCTLDFSDGSYKNMPPRHTSFYLHEG